MNNDISVGIKTFLRNNRIKRCLSSLVNKGFKEIIIADDGKRDPEKDKIYDKYSKKLPLKILRLSFDVGVSYGRNKIVKNCNTKYLLLLDDDQTINGNINNLVEVLNSNRSIGGVSGVLWENHKYRSSACNIQIKGNNLIKHVDRDNIDKVKTKNGLHYYFFDKIPNCTLFRTECLNEYKWDNNIKIGYEHIDYYLNHYINNSKWKFAVCPQVVINHYPGRRPNIKSEYLKYRGRKEGSNYKRYVYNKWNIKNVVTGEFFIDSHSLKRILTQKIININFPPEIISFMSKIFSKLGFNRIKM